MIPDSYPAAKRKELIDPAVMGPRAVWLASDAADRVNGERIVPVAWNQERANA